MISARTTDDVCTITLDRPQRRNALTWSGLEDLQDAVETAEAPVVYLHGEGAAFCAGADLDTVAALDAETAAEFSRLGQRVATTLAETDAVTVAGIDGAARGGGLELALACDIRVATPDATLAEPGVALGLFGAWGGTARLPRLVGLGEAMDLSLTGRVVDADEALCMGLVSQIREDPRAVATAIADHDPTTLSTIAGLVRDAGTQEQQESAEATAFARLLARTTFDDEP